MIFGVWRGISFNKDKKKLNTEGTEVGARRSLRRLGERGDFFVEVGQGGFQGFAVIGVGSGGQVVGDAGARELQLLDVLLAELLFGTLGFASR